jgi:hypothetical protein
VQESKKLQLALFVMIASKGSDAVAKKEQKNFSDYHSHLPVICQSFFATHSKETVFNRHFQIVIPASFYTDRPKGA